MLRRLCKLIVTVGMLGSAAAARAAPPAADEPADAATIDPLKPRLVLLTDGKQHYVAIEPFPEDSFQAFYYGDGKSFWAQRVYGGGSSGKESFDRVFWDPRAHAPYQAGISFKDGKYEVQCEERKTALQPVAEAEAKKLLDGAKFYKPRWKRKAYALARDNTGRYYYVDQAREPEGNKSFRLFAGPKGSLKLQKMTNVVSDSAGDIFATKSGELRLVLNEGEPLWQKGKAITKLIRLPVEDNHVLIYTDLGVYAGEKLGTPCDDL